MIFPKKKTSLKINLFQRFQNLSSNFECVIMDGEFYKFIVALRVFKSSLLRLLFRGREGENESNN